MLTFALLLKYMQNFVLWWFTLFCREATFVVGRTKDKGQIWGMGPTKYGQSKIESQRCSSKYFFSKSGFFVESKFLGLFHGWLDLTLLTRFSPPSPPLSIPLSSPTPTGEPARSGQVAATPGFHEYGWGHPSSWSSSWPWSRRWWGGWGLGGWSQGWMNMDEGSIHLLNSGSNRPNGNYRSTIHSFPIISQLLNEALIDHQ